MLLAALPDAEMLVELDALELLEGVWGLDMDAVMDSVTV